MPLRAIYPGTFDPITNGHLDLVERSRYLCDELILSIASNERKNPLFPVEERKALAEAALAERGLQAQVIIFDGLLVDLVKEVGASLVIRGVRAFSDFEYEFQMALMNRRLYPSYETVFLMPHESYSYLSSRMIKEVVRLGGAIDGLVPEVVKASLLRKLGGPPTP